MGATAAPDLIKEVETFAAGDYPGDKPGEVWSYTPDDVRTIARNFALLSSGEHPAHAVPVVATHDKVAAHGWVQSARPKGDILLTDWADVSDWLHEQIDTKRLKKVSAEIQRDFTDREGNVTPGPYLYRVAVLGADVPRVKGLKNIPAAFADGIPGRRITRIFRFADPKGPTMDFQAALAFLASKGIDVTPYSDQSPPECQQLAIAVATAWQQADMDATPPDATALSDPLNGAAGPKKVTVTQQYADARRQLQEEAAAALKTFRDAAAAETKARQQRETEERVKAVRLFCDNAKQAGKLSVAECDEGHPDSRLNQLLALARLPQHTTTQKFADGKQAERTPLEQAMGEIDLRPAQKFSEKMAVGAVGTDDFYKNLRASVRAEKAPAETKGKSLHERLNLLPGRQSR